MYLIFYKTNDVFAAEEILKGENYGPEVVPTPVRDKAYCGVCLKLENVKPEIVKFLLQNIEYEQVEEK